MCILTAIILFAGGLKVWACLWVIACIWTWGNLIVEALRGDGQ